MRNELDLIFQRAWDGLKDYHAFIRDRKAIISYSGGKDSSLLLQFYLWMNGNGFLQHSPCLYHLDHSIRDNESQEKSIFEYMKTIGWEFFFKKKTFRDFRSEPALA